MHCARFYLVQFEFIQISQEGVNSSLSHHLHGCAQRLKRSVPHLWSGVVYLLRVRQTERGILI